MSLGFWIQNASSLSSSSPPLNPSCPLPMSAHNMFCHKIPLRWRYTPRHMCPHCALLLKGSHSFDTSGCIGPERGKMVECLHRLADLLPGAAIGAIGGLWTRQAPILQPKHPLSNIYITTLLPHCSNCSMQLHPSSQAHPSILPGAPKHPPIPTNVHRLQDALAPPVS